MNLPTRVRSRFPWVPGLYLAAGIIWLLPLSWDPGGILFWRGGEYSDLLISHLPNAAYIHHAWDTWRQMPLWNPTILSGTPLAADPLAGLWYPPAWLAVVAPAPWTFNVLLWLHLAWSGLGVFQLLRRAGLGIPGALLAGLAYSGMPKLIGHAGLGHVSLVFAVCWTPWVLERVWAAADVCVGREPDRHRLIALAGALLGMVFLIDPRWFPQLALLSGAVAAWRLLGSRQSLRERLPEWLGAGMLALGFAVGILASLALPLSERLILSTRAALGAEEWKAYALPAERLLGIIAPDYGGWPEWQIYPGVSLLVLAIVAFWHRTPGARFWIGVAIAGWMMALGPQLPIFGLLRALVPGFSSLRVPARALFLSDLAIALAAGLGLHQLLLRQLEPKAKARVRLCLFAILLLQLALAGVVILDAEGSSLQERLPTALPYIIAGALLGVAWMGVERGVRLARRWLILGWGLFVMVDLGLMDLSLLEVRPIGDPELLHAMMARVQGSPPTRVISPSYSLEQPAAAEAGLELADGIHPLVLRRYWTYMAEALGFSANAYSVTLPPYPAGRPQQPWSVQPDAERLGLLNVAYLVSAYSIHAEGWNFDGIAEGSYIYRNSNLRPRAWVEGQEGGAIWQPVERLEWTPNEISIIARGPGTLVLSEIEYPGWSARVEGEEQPIQSAHGILRAVELPEGTHEVVFRYLPRMAMLGTAMTLLTALTLGMLWIKR